VPSNTPTWLKLHAATSRWNDWVVVDESVLGSWGPGAEILITSHTREWDEHQERTITKIQRALDFPGKAKIWLDRTIAPATTSLVDSQDFAVEVALLSRNIVFASGDDDNSFHGGHFWIMNTPNVVQSIVGKSIVPTVLFLRRETRFSRCS